MEKVLTKYLEQQVKDLDTTKGIVTVYINAFNVEDSDSDISMPGSFKRTFKNNGDTIQHWLNHDRNQLIGVPIKLYEDEIGAIAVSQLNLNKQIARDVFEDYKLFAAHNKTLQHSVRVMPIKFEEDRSNNRYVRRVNEWKMVMEFSTVYGWGSNQQTPLIDIKSMDDLELMMREGNYSDEKAKEIEVLYNKLKMLLAKADPQDTPPQDPSALTEQDRIIKFYQSLKL